MKTLHVVGFKNSGKTTLISRWVRLLKSEGMTVSVLKHHGHASLLNMPDENTDGMQFFKSGADLSLVAGAGTAQMLLNEEPSFAQLIDMATLNQPDVLLIEGYKNEQGCKVVLLRDDNDWQDLQQLSDIQFIIGHGKMELDVEVIDRSNEGQVDDWFLQWVKEDGL
ncbi:molybdopterin-guanine dinucleotide biosynthesis protein B [Sporosarcina ureilytica]|uniref:Molybdopterin-guanine dinucleotide biosynthesis protein B n=1 Tax=Sporosarcina ureilytica TaxID=298596 RepID=A0A1D8JKP3_9BACL|nr:molybdopterin-guanine dinucleotide biosynthesis protein B [Sporosarcina ureilytica]AOV09288.1 molybdopterin-guanine dinucleotide biosynthesis protein B [Sporosarcina ureilytica]